MGAEYVRFAQSEAVHGQKNLLESQVNLLQGLKRFKAYRLLRAEEIHLKIQLKQQMDTLAEQLNILNRVLPQTEFKPAPQPKALSPAQPKQAHEATLETHHENSLEDELEAIQRKLRALQ
ncbi:hypothetical protein EXS73_01525 [Candidatus Pacearchaeota archaeon]|nr:hypothetical protein [Candidatus Pacearchaeota archaeon]